MTAAMILAAGLGTRLRPLTDELPKPLLWLGDRPLVAHIAERLAAGSVRRVVLNRSHLAERFSREILAALPAPVEAVDEPEPFGTAGGLANAARALGEGDVIVWNGDILIDLDVAALSAAHAAHGQRGAGATLAVAPRPAGEGTVGVGARGEVVRLRGERFGDEAAGGDFVGVHGVGEALRRRLPPRGCMVGDVYLPWLREGRALATFPAPAVWHDIGTIAAYLAANARWLSQRGLQSYVGPGACVAEGVDVTGSVVGAGARVEGVGALRRCVVWPGARVAVGAGAPLERAVVTTKGAVARAPA
ncbi:nucleotidyl transferase [Sorangium cellulosum]|jgi:mannose-1-phosphate guanylyltransferase|uniref:Nucleotidyl transferase n=1 Tax=Sorangium cellulosum TaxID=56 RepID=A0A4P2Q141_SORCE|nr:NDP-sugar synthase [Sorangium cellulosum]AUX22945.1 nucleotidyl transferase [Sorangium cellulosum]